jgi:hypothetical protein
MTGAQAPRKIVVAGQPRLVDHKASQLCRDRESLITTPGYHFYWLPRLQDRPRRHLADGTAWPRSAGRGDRWRGSMGSWRQRGCWPQRSLAGASHGGVSQRQRAKGGSRRHFVMWCELVELLAGRYPPRVEVSRNKSRRRQLLSVRWMTTRARFGERQTSLLGYSRLRPALWRLPKKGRTPHAFVRGVRRPGSI